MSMNKVAYITKYALHRGILCVSVLRHCTVTGWLYTKQPGLPTNSFRQGEWSFDPTEASRMAEEMKAKKILSLEKKK